jgi:Cytochrome bd terminal oxidase subunit I
MDLDAFLISRLQFAFTIIWHIIFPPFTIGLSAYIATLCVMWMRTGKEHYRELARFWTKIFVINSPLLLARARPNTVVDQASVAWYSATSQRSVAVADQARLKTRHDGSRIFYLEINIMR